MKSYNLEIFMRSKESTYVLKNDYHHSTYTRSVNNGVNSDQMVDNCKESIEKGSSETIRKATFCFSNVQRHLPLQKRNKQPSKEFLEWFCGFAEGDGSFQLSKDKSSSSMVNGRALFVINQKHCRALRLIRKQLGFGSVKKYKDFFRYTVSSKEGILCLISIFNGNLLLPKTRLRFKSWLDRYLGSPKVTIAPLPGPDWKELPFLETAWLSGFIDAEGCFSVYPATDKRYKKGFRIRFVFTLDQKDGLPKTIGDSVTQSKESDKGYLLLEELAKRIGSGSVAPRKETPHMYRYSLWGKKAQETLIRYLSRYPLRSSKILQYKRWSALHRLSSKPNWLKTLSEKRLVRKIAELQKVEDRVRPLGKP